VNHPCGGQFAGTRAIRHKTFLPVQLSTLCLPKLDQILIDVVDALTTGFGLIAAVIAGKTFLP